ncbi:hypothetical protein [Nonomuraea guangzhouensis]|uniref:Uncharacterized protein n=1 Tax=Nonomuraea guangzhouensis TaxID=1291555 RepID=A0ABW4G765_9ACTN|nr:hypothetical protein [Nonomuraea guangzhouensis]
MTDVLHSGMFLVSGLAISGLKSGLGLLPILGLIAISGIFYPLTVLPEWVRWSAQAFPIYRDAGQCSRLQAGWCRPARECHLGASVQLPELLAMSQSRTVMFPWSNWQAITKLAVRSLPGFIGITRPPDGR